MSEKEIESACAKELGKKSLRHYRELIDFAARSGATITLGNGYPLGWKAAFRSDEVDFESEAESMHLAVCRAFLVWKGILL